MKVYIVTSGDYSDYGIDRVFLTKEKAELYSKFHQDGWSPARIEEYDTADDYEPKDTYYKVYSTFKMEDGKDTELIKFEYVLVAEDSYDIKDTYYDCRENEVRVNRRYRAQDCTIEEIKSKIEKIGYDTCAFIKNEIANGVPKEEIKRTKELNID